MITKKSSKFKDLLGGIIGWTILLVIVGILVGPLFALEKVSWLYLINN